MAKAKKTTKKKLKDMVVKAKKLSKKPTEELYVLLGKEIAKNEKRKV